MILNCVNDVYLAKEIMLLIYRWKAKSLLSTINLFDLTLRTNELDACFMGLKLEQDK